MSPAGNWSEESSGKLLLGPTWNYLGTYIAGSVTLEGAVMDLCIGTSGRNSTALEIACGPPGHGEKFRKFLSTIIHPLTQ
jgi:hypothetical protein